MALEYDIQGFIDVDGVRHYAENEPDNLPVPGEAMGLFVHVHDTETGLDEFFWSYDFGYFKNWDAWYDYIETQMEMYGYV